MSTERTEADEKSGEPWVWGLVVVGGALIVALWLGAKWLHGLVPTDSTEASARLEAAYAALETLFSGLAFLGVIAAVLFQREELKLQRQELRETRAELKRTADEQKRAADQLNRQVEVMARTARIQALSALMDRAEGRYNTTQNHPEVRRRGLVDAETCERKLREELDAAGLMPTPPSTTP